jgi:hypothetical protein
MNMIRIPIAQKLSCSKEEACAATGFTPKELDDEIEAGRVRIAMIGGRPIVIVASLLHLLAELAVPCQPPPWPAKSAPEST